MASEQKQNKTYQWDQTKSWRFNLAFIVIMAVVTGLVVHYMLAGILNDSESTPFRTILIAALFTVVFTFSFKGASQFLTRYFITNSLRNLWIRISVASIVMIAAFIMTAWVIDQFSGVSRILDWNSPVFYTIAGVSFLACIIGNTIYFGSDFYNRFLEAERARHESQMAALKSQINPHFLFNSLNSIASLVRIDPVKAERVIEDLSDLFRYSLLSSKKEEMKLEDELTAVQSYFAIEKARFGDRVAYTVDIPDNLRQLSVPGLILQPLIENSVKHGAAKTTDPFYIHVSAHKKDNILHIEVADSGTGFSQSNLDEITGRGTGLSNIRDRLQLQYGNRARLIPHGQSVKLEIPING
ncbi:MAG: histidine kinase [Balneolales bacterium]